MSKYVIPIDIPADEWLTLNKQLHFAERNRRVQALRIRAKFLAKMLKIPKLIRIMEMNSTVAYPHGKRADYMNAQATVKALEDGLVDAGVIDDDDDRHIPIHSYARDRSYKPSKGWHRITITLYTAGEKSLNE